jgi:hypothetical protein
MNKRHKKKKEELGKLILQLRTAKEWSRGDVIGLCHKKRSESEPNYNYDEVPNETWFARLERGEGATYSLREIELLLAVLKPTPKQRVEILLVAELPLSAEPDGEVTPEGCLLSMAYSKLMGSRYVKKAVHKYVQNLSDQEISEEKFYLDILQIAVQAGQEELARKERLQAASARPVDTSIALSGAD